MLGSTGRRAGGRAGRRADRLPFPPCSHAVEGEGGVSLRPFPAPQFVFSNGEWSQLSDPEALDPRFAMFWFNSITRLTQWEEPDWPEIWKAR